MHENCQRSMTLESLERMAKLAEVLEAEHPCLWRHMFAIPTMKSTGISDSSEEVTYLCGNSLGLMPIEARNSVNAELEAWAGEGVIGHHKRFDGKDPWISNYESVSQRLADLVFGCLPSEISFSGTLTANLNSMLQTFYQPTPQRYKLMCEAKAFPSDIYAFQNQVRLHGYDPKDALVLVEPREGEFTIRTDDLISYITEMGSSLALVCMPGIQFYTGQYFDIPRITEATKKVGAVSGWDLAHASGNVPLKLHEWGLDFAVFCSYKYLNCGAGNIGGFFVHEDTARKYASKPRPAGWWGVDPASRFNMGPDFVPAEGARGFMQSNLNLFAPACMHASLDAFERAGGVPGLAPRSHSLSRYLTARLRESKHYGKSFKIMTDELNEDERGCQLSIFFVTADEGLMPKILDRLLSAGIIGDERKPNVIRWAPTPLYNTHQEVDYAVRKLDEALDELVEKY